MKRFLLFSLILMGCNALQAAAPKVIITMDNDKTYQGRVVELTDSTITFIWDLSFKQLTMSASAITTLSIDGDHYIVKDGKFVSKSDKIAVAEKADYQRASVVVKQSEKYSSTSDPYKYSRMSDPNYAIGSTLHATGSISLALGIPSLVTGTILLIVGLNDSGNTNMTKALRDSKMATAGCVLTPFGGALTIVGIPLCAKGNQILKIKFNYAGTGGGVSVEF